MVLLTLSKKLNQFIGPRLLRLGIKLRYGMDGGILKDNPTADAVVLLPVAQKLIELEAYDGFLQDANAAERVAVLESYIRPALLPNEQWGDVQKWQFHMRLLKWLRKIFLIARHPVPPRLPKSIQESPQLQPYFQRNSKTTRRLPLTSTVQRTFGMMDWSVQKQPNSRHDLLSRLLAQHRIPQSRVVRIRGGAVCFVHVEDNKKLSTNLSHVPLEHVLELAGCHVATCGPFNTLCEETGMHNKNNNNIYQLWTQEYVERLAHYLWKRWCSRSKKDEDDSVVILDVGAGDGLLSQLLRDRFAEYSTSTTSRLAQKRTTTPPEVIASDDGSWSIDPLAKVEPWTVQEALQKVCEETTNNKKVVVLCSWMPMNEDWTALFRSAGVEEYILIGECDDGQCGDNWETWGNHASLSLEELTTDDHEVNANSKPPPYELDGYERVALSSFAPHQLSRFDGSTSKTGQTVSFRRRDINDNKQH